MCQNISKEVLLSASKYQAKIRTKDMGMGTVIHSAFKNEWLRIIGHSMSMILDIRKSNLEINKTYGFIFGSL